MVVVEKTIATVHDSVTENQETSIYQCAQKLDILTSALQWKVYPNKPMMTQTSKAEIEGYTIKAVASPPWIWCSIHIAWMSLWINKHLCTFLPKTKFYLKFKTFTLIIVAFIYRNLELKTWSIISNTPMGLACFNFIIYFYEFVCS